MIDARLTFDADKHQYRLDGKPIPSVTQILKSAGMISFDSVPRDVLDAAAKFGTAVHLATELADRGTLDHDALDPALAPYLQAWRDFVSDHAARIDGIEGRVCSHRWLCAGTYDRVMTIGRKRILADLKTSVALSPAVGPQTAAYAAMFEELTAIKIRERWAIRLTADGYRVTVLKDKSDLNVFLSALQIHNWKAQHNLLKGEEQWA